MDGLGNAGTPEERRTGIGGSDAAAALGLSPWVTPYNLWELKRGLAPPPEENEPMLWGTLLEDVIRREYARRAGVEARPVKEMIRHPQHAFMFAHLDGEIIGLQAKAILEVKTARTAVGWGEEGTDEIPLHYLIQVHHSMVVTDAELCDVAVLIGGQDFRVYHVDRDAEIEQRVTEGEALFWDMVTAGEPPPPSSLQDAVRRWGRSDAQGTVVAGRPELDAISTLRSLKLQKAKMAVMEEAAKTIVMALMGDDGMNLVDGGGQLLATWKLNNGRKGYTVAPQEPQRIFLVKESADD
jgi:putative phage-type endonuclease